MKQLLRLIGVLVGLVVLAAAALGAVFVGGTRTSSVLLPIGEETTSEVFALEPLYTGLALPVYLTHAGDSSGRLFIVEQKGTIRIAQDGQVLPEPFLELGDKVATVNWEQGLLSVAFHPNYQENGRFFVYYVSAEDGRSVIEELQVSPDNPNLALNEGKVVLEIPNGSGLEEGVHYGGQLQFGPDGYLYISIGDGYQRPEVAPGKVKPSQDLSQLPGSILRIDVDGGDPYAIPADNPFVNKQKARPEIWAYGLRNPWRFSFDRATGELFVGDVGFVQAEEINIVKAGRNYGWPIMEGANCYVETFVGRTSCYVRKLQGRFVDPIVYYNRFLNDKVTEGRTSGVVGGNSVTGGYVYRGKRFPALQGQFFAADFIFGNVWSIKKVRENHWEATSSLKTPYQVSSFGEDEAGELYALEWGTGTVFSVTAKDVTP